MPLNRWIVATVAQKIGAVETAEIFPRDRAAGPRDGGDRPGSDWRIRRP